jgi:hypothetical protein
VKGGRMCVQLDWLISFAQTFGPFSPHFFPSSRGYWLEREELYVKDI